MAIACCDVHYPERGALAACVVLSSWEARCALEEHVVHVPAVEPYVPGAFFRRELPCLQAVLSRIETPLAAIVVDGYVWLDARGRLGLGARLFIALEGRVPVIGVAKTRFGPQSESAAIGVLRGASRRPLFVTAAGIDPHDAARCVQAMHGDSRLPWALSRVDRLCRLASSRAHADEANLP